MHKILTLRWTALLLFLTAACGGIETVTNDFTPTPPSNPSPSTSPGPQNVAAVHVSDFLTTGIISAVQNLDFVTASDITPNVVAPLPHTDATLRAFDGLLYIVNRLGRDNIQVVDPASGFDTLIDFSVGAGTNPHDILVFSDTKAFVTLYQPEAVSGSEELHAYDPQTGSLLKKINLTPFTDDDGERLARPERMVRVGNEIWILLQDLDGSFTADTNGKIVVINGTTFGYVDTDLVAPGVQAIELEGRNPSLISYDAATDRVYVSMTGVFDNNFETDTSDPYGGIEVIDPNTYQSLGILIDDADLGGFPWGVEIRSATMGFTTADSKRVVLFNPSTSQVINKNIYQSPGTFLPEIHLDGDGLLLITERGDADGQNAGLVILDLLDNFAKQGPFNVGGPPNSLATVEIP